MERSQKNTSSSSGGGFIYFNPKFLSKSNTDLNASQNLQNIDTQDFLAFNDSPVQNNSSRTHQGFSPSNFSSPKYNQMHTHQSPHRYNKSPRARGLHSNNYSGNYSFNNPNRFESSPNSSRNYGYNQRSSHKWQRHSGYANASNSSFQKGNTSIFYDTTCLENPWLQLEKQLEEKTRQENEESLKTEQNTEIARQISEDSDIETSGEEESSSDDKEVS